MILITIMIIPPMQQGISLIICGMQNVGYTDLNILLRVFKSWGFGGGGDTVVRKYNSPKRLTNWGQP